MASGKREKRLKLAEAQNWRCCYCGGRLHENGMRLDGATLEHVVTRADGGSNADGNLVVACSACNLARGGFYSAKVFYRLRRLRLRKRDWPPCTTPRKAVRKWLAEVFVEAEMARLTEDWKERRRIWAQAA